MSNLSITTRVIQKLSNNTDSVIPVAVKDTLSNCAITYIYDKQASREDGKERAIEEFGTEVVWIGGIPLLKKLFDATVYKFFNADPKFDVRNLKKNSDGKLEKLEFLAKNAKDATQKKTLENILKDKNLQKLYKKLHVSKFITATGATLAALSALIVFKQKTTQKQIEEKYRNKIKLRRSIANNQIENKVFNNFLGKPKDVSFGNGLTSKMAEYMFNPLKNMQILDGGIAATRLAQGRKGERFEIGFKEGFQIIFMYFLAKPIQVGLEKVSEKLFKTPIKAEFQLLSNENFPQLLNSSGLKESIEAFLSKNDKEALEYIFNNDNALVKMLKISGEIPTIKKGNGVIDSLAYIELDDVRKGAKNILQLLEASVSKSNKDQFLRKVKNFKAVAVVLNILIGAAAIGVLQPMLNIVLRKKKNNGESANPAIKNLETEMAQKFAFEG